MATVTDSTVRYRVDSAGQVSLAGSAWIDAAYDEKFFRLPVGARPANTLAFFCPAETEGYGEVVINIYADGGISAAAGYMAKVYFDAVSFLVGQ